jgi:trk system potassium uptake protein TrkA
MRVIVVGAGEVGYHVAERLSNEKQDVVVVDVAPERLEYVQNHLDVAVVEGSGASPSVLEEAGIREAGLLTAVTSIDEVNLVCCMSVRGGDDLVKVARVSNPDFYADGAHLRPELFGVDVMINPERELALETIRLLEATAATDIAIFAGGAVQLVGLRVTDDAPIAGKTFSEIGAEVGAAPLLTVAIRRGARTIVPTGATGVVGGDHLYFVATDATISRALEMCGYRHTTVHRVMIAGGSHEAYYLAQLLQQHRGQAIMLVKERDRAQELAEKLDKALVLNGDATDVELLELEGVGGVDAFVALTDHDETNILSRRGSVTSVATFKDIDAEAIAFKVSEASPLRDRKLADIEFPTGAIVAAIVRSGDEGAVVPTGDDVLLPDDTAILFALPEAVGPVTELFPS